MGYIQSEVPKELIKGKEYTERQLMLYVINNRHESVLSQSVARFSDYSDRLLTVIDVCEGYLHTGNGSTTYNIPSSKSKIYIVS